MTNQEYTEVCDILAELQDEFIDEEERLLQVSREYSYRITELDAQIKDAKNNEDLDFKVFSPRNIDLGSSDKVKAMETEKETLEKEKVDAEKQISYYTAKSDKLGKVLLILKKYAELDDEFASRIDGKVRAFDPFAFIDETNNDSSDDNSSDEFINDSYIDDKLSDINSFDNTIDDETDVFSISRKRSGNEIFDSLVAEEESEKTKLLEVEAEEEPESEEITAGVPVDSIKKVCHKVEFTEKILNDRLRAKVELKEVISDLHKLIDTYK